MNRIAIIAALPGELNPLVQGWQRRGQTMWVGQLAGSEAVAVAGGMGAAAAAHAAEQALKELDADVLMSYGWAGALTCAVKPQMTCIISEVVDAVSGERFATGNADGFRMITLDHVARADEKRALAQKHQAVIVDMEASTVARIAAARQKAFYCFKAIADGYTDKLPDFNKFMSDAGEIRTGALIAHAAVRPQYWASLIRLGKNSSAAADALAKMVQNGSKQKL